MGAGENLKKESHRARFMHTRINASENHSRRRKDAFGAWGPTSEDDRALGLFLSLANTLASVREDMSSLLPPMIADLDLECGSNSPAAVMATAPLMAGVMGVVMVLSFLWLV
jgi:hypothetical protein